jgi:hypothetical protein
MGRPAIRKRGPLTGAERQRRHRQKLKRERREAEKLAAREKNLAGYRSDQTDFVGLVGPPPEVMAYVAPKVEDLADEIARQTGEAMQESGVSWDDVQAALQRLGLTSVQNE